MNLLFVIQKPYSMVKWFTSNPEIAGFAFEEGWSVKCLTSANKVIR